MVEARTAPEIGPRLQALRKKRKLTLEDLARLSGVSRSMLSQIERGQANPTFATLWHLTQALGLDLAELASGQVAEIHHDSIEVTQAHFTPEIRSADGGCTLRILGPVESLGLMEWYEILIEPGASLISEPHAKGTREHLTAFNGSFEITSGDARAHVEPGGTARYAADKPHVIKNPGKSRSRGILVVQG